MGTGAVGSYMDVAQIVLYIFWIFFAFLILYLHREGKREGYPLDAGDRKVRVVGFPDVPKPKGFLRRDGTVVMVPRPEPKQDLNMMPTERFPGAPMRPTGSNPMVDGVGPGAFSEREDVPDLTSDDKPMIVPMRTAPEFHMEERDPDPRGMDVVGADGVVGGKIVDVWVDRAEPQIRFMEAEVQTASGTRRVLVPINFTLIEGPDEALKVTVRAIMGRHFADIPGTRNPEIVTKLEEEKIFGYFGAGTLYADPAREESLV